jgi:dynein heavy chain
MLVKMLREEETLYAISYYVESVLGKKFTSNHPESIEDIYTDTDHKTPLIFILSMGADPLASVMRLATAKKVTNDRVTVISLGQGQGLVADRAMDS